MVVFSCRSNQETGNFELLPSPKKFMISGNSNLKAENVLYYWQQSETVYPFADRLPNDIKAAKSESQAQIICGIDSSLDVEKEGYALKIGKKLIKITGKDEAGLLYGFMTLEQLMADAAEQNTYLPKCEITDYPSLSYRAIHLDVKHHLEKKDYYYRMIDKLAGYKINAIIVELEDKIKYTGHPVIGSDDAWTVEQWKELSEYAMRRNIEISPLVQGLGHVSFILKHDEYKSLRDDPTNDWAFNPLDSKVYDVLFDMYLDAMEATPYGRYLHIGGDEVNTTGRNSGKTPIELQMIWLEKVCKFLDDHGRIPVFWDDMPLKQTGLYNPMFDTKMTKDDVEKIWENNEYKLASFLDRFPKNCVYMRWNYHSPQTVGNQKSMEWFMKNGFQVMGATAGQTRWVLMPQRESNIDNIEGFAKVAIDKNIDKLLLTLWDDDSPHFELYWRGIVAFAEYTWAGIVRSKEEVKKVFRHREFSSFLGDDKYAFIDELEQPVAHWENLLLQKGKNRKTLRKAKDPLNRCIIDIPATKSNGEWSKKYEKRLANAETDVKICEKTASKINLMKQKAIRNSYMLDVYGQVNQMVLFTNKALLCLKEYDMASTQQQKNEAEKKIAHLPEEFKTIRTKLEDVYGQTRILTKPDHFILDQDHHSHLANQAVTFDWQFYAEMLFMEKISRSFGNR